MTAYQLAQYLGAAGTAAFMIYHLVGYFVAASAPPTAIIPQPTPKEQPRATAATSEKRDLTRCVAAFGHLQEIKATLLEECGIEGEKAAQLLEPLAPLLLRQKGAI